MYYIHIIVFNKYTIYIQLYYIFSVLYRLIEHFVTTYRCISSDHAVYFGFISQEHQDLPKNARFGIS